MDVKKVAKVNPRKLAKQNPRVDLQKLDEAQGKLADLQAAGISRHSYDLSVPYERRPVLRRDSRVGR